MILTDLTLTNFRSFGKKSFEFSSGLTVIVGPNTIGKTNILEAVYLLATGKSFRAEEEKEIISYGEEITRIKGQLVDCHSEEQSDEESRPKVARASLDPSTTGRTGRCIPSLGMTTSLEIVLTTGFVGGQIAPRKKYLVNGVAKRMVDFLGNLRAALFWPEDLELVTDSPSVRRKYLDSVLCQVDREYARCLLSYEKGVRQRNKLLERIRDEGAPRSQLTFWDQLLIKNGGVLTEKRMEYIDFINKQSFSANGENRHSEASAEESHEILRFAQDDMNYKLQYDKSIISESRLEQYSQNEVGAAMTLVGPHRDDVKFEIRFSARNLLKASNSKSETPRDLSLYGSRGEQRMAVLWLKLGELEFMAKKTGSRPILLLDDIFSELDQKHRERVLEIIPHQQTIMTTTDLNLIDKKFIKEAQIIEL